MTLIQSTNVASIGVGIDTSRYGHHVSFLRDDLQPATEPIMITENRKGYEQLLGTLQDLKRRHPKVVFQVRLDEAGQGNLTHDQARAIRGILKIAPGAFWRAAKGKIFLDLPKRAKQLEFPFTDDPECPSAIS